MHTQTVRRKPKGERHRARDWYVWLWLSPFLTIPTLIFLLNQFEDLLYGSIFPNDYLDFSFELAFKLSALLAVLGSSLWHLILLIPSLDRQSEFVRWHGRQMFILAGIRTAVPILFVLAIGDGFRGLLISAVILIVIWLVGNIWGQQQAKRGDCSLMRWTGKQELLPGPELEDKKGIPDLMKAIRFSKDPRVRSRALAELQKLGMVEEL